MSICVSTINIQLQVILPAGFTWFQSISSPGSSNHGTHSMFRSHEKSPSKMKFQKPNILRKRPKSTAKSNVAETLNKMSSTGQPQMNSMNISDWNIEKLTKHKYSKLTHFTKKPISRIKLESYLSEENERKCNTVRNDSLNGLVQLNHHMQSADFPEITNISNSFSLQDCAFDIEGITLKDFTEVSSLESKWCFLPIRDDRKNILAQYDESQESKLGEISTIDKSVDMPEAMVVVNTDVSVNQKSANNCVAVIELLPKNYACDIPDCNKEFPSEQRLKKHKHTIHNKSGTRVQSIDCPANKPGETMLCGDIFTVREDVLNHLKEHHTLEDAVYRCESCSRRFFWSAGLRAHWRACGGAARAVSRPALACPWPGCGRVFLQPCRLKEHSRAHTGDKPYPCRFPNCNWSFRTASKLLRHARRHTGERRHRCEQCGRAFLRGEHLREHVARHARPSKPPGKPRAARRKRPDRLISLPFVDEATEPTPVVEAPLLCLQRVKSDASDAAPVTPVNTTLAPSPLKPSSDWSDEEDPFFQVTVQSPAPTPGLTEASGPVAESTLERSARTHCTWPLSRASTEVYVLADDAQVELSEATETESKIYTIRSDLFLHGNVIHSEDSESGVAVIAAASTNEGAESGEVGGGEGETRDAGGGQGAALDAELGLLDATSAIDLMQEELMYTAAATDDSNFQLLSDGEYHYWLAT